MPAESASATAGRISQRTGLRKAPATIATPAPITSAATTVLAAGGRGPGSAERDDPAEDEDADPEGRALRDVSGVAAGSFSGDEPPDKDTGRDQKGERDENPAEEKPAAEKKGPADEQQDHHAGDHEAAIAAVAGRCAAGAPARRPRSGRAAAPPGRAARPRRRSAPARSRAMRKNTGSVLK